MNRIWIIGGRDGVRVLDAALIQPVNRIAPTPKSTITKRSTAKKRILAPASVKEASLASIQFGRIREKVERPEYSHRDSATHYSQRCGESNHREQACFETDRRRQVVRY